MSSTKARIVLIVTSILAIVVVAILLVRVRHPMAVASIAPYTSTPAASLPLGTRRPNIPPPKVGNTSTVQVCGYGQLPIEGDDTSAIFQQVGALTKGASTRWMAALQNSGDLRARVAGLLLEGKVTGGDSLRPVAEQTRNEVVQLAAGSVDPAVYGMALSMCETSAGTDMDSACRQLTLRRWAQIDPDNAVPWLLLAGAARARHDSVAEADAFTHAATAHRVDSYSDSVFAFAEPELPHDVTPLERSYLATEVIGVESGIRLPQYSAVSRHCSSSAMQDGAVRQQCDLIAELLVTQGTNFLDLGLGRSIGERVG